jgi:O-antigen/teichoic acid export membrane protein
VLVTANEAAVTGARANRPTVVAASGAYFLARALLMVAGLISMPILTRLLSKEEYGLLSLFFATVTILVVVGQLGFGEATLRLYSERRAHGRHALRELCDTMLGGSLAASLLVAAATLLCTQWFVAARQPYYARCLWLASVLVVIRGISGVLYQVYRAQERAFAHAAAQIAARYGTMVLALSCFLLSHPTAITVIVATLIVEAIVVAVRVFDLAASGVISRPKLVRPLLAAATVYGVPLAIAGSARYLLNYGDRFLIERFLGLDAVASYSVPYDLAEHVGDAMFGPAGLAVMPIIFRLWAHEGREATSKFASQILTYGISLAIPVGVLYWLCNQDLIDLLATANYRDSARLTPLILPGVFLSGINFIVVAGLTVQKNTVLLALNVCGAAMVNLVLNLFLIRRWGLSGAALATTLGYGALFVANYLTSRSVLDLRLEYSIIGKALLATAAMDALLYRLGHVSSRSVVDVAARGMLGAAAVALVFWLLDRNARQWVRLQLRGSRQ